MTSKEVLEKLEELGYKVIYNDNMLLRLNRTLKRGGKIYLEILKDGKGFKGYFINNRSEEEKVVYITYDVLYLVQELLKGYLENEKLD